MRENKAAAEKMEGELMKVLTTVPEVENGGAAIPGDGDVAMTSGDAAPAPDPPANELDRIKAQISAVDQRKSYLNSRIAAFEQQQVTREAKLRDLIAKATGFPPENMDESMLRALLEELQAD